MENYRKYLVFTLHLMVFSNAPSSGDFANVSRETRLENDILVQPPLLHTSGAAAPQHDILHSHPRWRRQLAFSKSVYSFQVYEDTAPGTVVGKVEATRQGLTPITYSVLDDDGENLFLLGPLSGEFLLSRSLDYEAQRFYVLTVAVQQGDVEVSSVRVYFNVLNVNDNPPVFSQDSFSVSLLEDTQVGTCFLSLNVSDEDEDGNEELRFNVHEGDKDVFFINSAGSLCLKQELDREEQPSYSLTITAHDCVQPESLQLTSTARVTVLVEDVNDNAPAFVSPNNVTIPEDSELHSVVTMVRAEDKDTGPNGDILYYLNGSSSGMFSINAISGNVYLNETLDREQVDVVIITITAADRGSPTKATVLNLTVHVEDTNDHDPEFSQDTYRITVREDEPRGTSLLQVRAHDRDTGPNGQVRYVLNQKGPFVVDSVRGVVTLMDKLDRENESNYVLVLTAVDQGNSPRSALATVTVTVLDVNDCAPQFSPETLDIHVMENVEDPALLSHQLSALDEDTEHNSQLTYSIQMGNRDGLFSVTVNGTLQILNSLDREKESLYVITITAVDSGFPPLTGTLTVNIIVDDDNDNSPEFTESIYNTIVYEDSPTDTVFAIITANDPDVGLSGEISYFTDNPNLPFTIDETSGELRTTDVLDREKVAIYTLTVVSRDKHPTEPLSSSVLVIVLIGDVNDHWPQFTNSPYVAHVPLEMAPGSVVFAVSATDDDSEMNADLHYSLYGPSSDLFSIDPNSGTVFTSSALLQTQDITLNVHVEDAGDIPKFDITTISIKFHNDSHFPQLSVEVLSHSLPEDEPPGTLVAVFSALSLRADPVSFYLGHGHLDDVFHVAASNGEMTLDKPLDYENQKQFSLLVEARDSGSPPFSSFVIIAFNISDVNDNIPQFTQTEYRCEVLENSQPSWVCDILAIDADSGVYGTVWYSITEGNDDLLFDVDPENGILSTAESLDRESISEFSLVVQAAEIDNPHHRDRATVIVTVLDRNDNAPRFPHIFVAEVSEDANVGHTVTQITATDDDTGPNAVIHYSITDYSNDIPFNIDSTRGYITVEKLLDREMQDHYVLKVTANDSAWSISTDVTIVVTDVNDNQPVFLDQVYEAILPETQDVDVFILQVQALDADSGQNAEVLYVIEPSNEVFWVNTSSGEIYTKQPLTLLHSSFKVYQLTVTALDCGSVPLYSNTTVTIRLEPYNHYAPEFLPTQLLMAVPSHIDVGTEVIQFAAIDPDGADRSLDIGFTVKGGNASDFFWIQADIGKVHLQQNLTESINLFLTLTVEAVDRGVPPLSSLSNVTFEITEKNLYPPSFREPNVTFTVPEDLPTGSVIGRIQAEDADDGLNGEIAYSFIPGKLSLPFSVEKSSGLLKLIKELDFEEKVMYHLQIKAVDRGWFAKTGVVGVTVAVSDVNDNPPVFSSSGFLTSVPENSEIGSSVIDLTATDADSGVNGQISYSLIAGHVDKFAISSESGTITTLQVFDYEQEQIFDVTVKASNAGGHNVFTLAHVVIQVSDVNEFKPKFARNEVHFSVFKNVPVGSEIGKVTAADDDGGAEGQVFYLTFGQNSHMGFDIEELSGEIFTTVSLRKLVNSDVVLNVLAKNRGIITGVDEDEILVRISVIDTNEVPMFTSALYLVNVTEDSPVGTSVTTVSAVDEDSILEYNSFFFSIENGNTNLSFDIHPVSGVISVKSPLDRELWSVYDLTVTATDYGSPPGTGSSNVLIFIEDINDNHPQLTVTKAQVTENQPQGTIVAQLNASDSDVSPNQGPFTYWLVNPLRDRVFSVTPDGILSTTRPIDREQTSVYQILLVVQDAGNPPLSSTSTLHILIADENDNPPVPRNIFIEVKYFGSSFQGGMIGNVHPEDADESDTFSCSVKSGLPNMFVIPNGTCELWSSPFQGEATFNVTIEATDQLYFPVNNSVYVKYKGFTNASIDSCILFYVSSSSTEEFLSSQYLRFVKALDSLFNLQASKTHVFEIKRIGGEILLLAAVKNYNGDYLSKEVARGISAGHRKLLETQSNVVISHITSDPCVASPCKNGGTCNKNIYISSEVAVLESLSVIFVSPQTEVFNCTCPDGFMGTLCQYDIDECERNPCQNEGGCTNTAGSFTCHCQSGFSGSICSVDEDQCQKVDCRNGGTCISLQEGYYCHCVSGYEGDLCEEFIDHCQSSPCVHGNCTNSRTGFSCHCTFGVTGVFCENHSYGFEDLSFMEFPPLDRRTNLISLEFATVLSNSLLLYNSGGSSSTEFFALELLEGSISLSYDLGSGPVRLETKKNVSDGQFHSVTIRRIGNKGSVHVDNCTDVEKDGFCFLHSDGSGLERTLDVGNNNLTVGGLKDFGYVLLRPAHIAAHDFVGCMRNIYINGIQLTPSTALATQNILKRCPRTEDYPCQSNPCQNGGVCHDMWSHYICECQSPFTGSTCTTELSEQVFLRFSGRDYIEYVFKETFQRDQLLKELHQDHGEESQSSFNIKFRTKENGVLFFLTGEMGSATLKIADRRPVYLFKDRVSGQLSEWTLESPVTDGDWHSLSILITEDIMILSLNGEKVLNITDRRMEISPAHVKKLILGAALTEDLVLEQPGFTGCVQYFVVDNHALPFSGHSIIADVHPSSSLSHPTCVSPALCLSQPCPNVDSATRGCLSEPCLNQLDCGHIIMNLSCVCLQNVSGQSCDICTSSESCSGAQSGAPVWLTAVILPLITSFIIGGMFVVFSRVRRRSETLECLTLPQKSEQGADNAAFFCDDDQPLTEAAGKDPPQELVSPYLQKSNVHRYSEASPSVPQSELRNELDYYEVGSICSELHSEVKQWRDLTTLLAGLQQERFMETSATNQEKASENQQLSRPTKAFPQPEFSDPVPRLTLEEITKLNAPLTSSAFRAGPDRSTRVTKVSSDSGSDSTLSGSESEIGQGSTFRCRDQRCGPKQQEDSSGFPEKWNHVLKPAVPFCSYPPVFEDLARLPVQSNHCHDLQGDIEEVI